MVSSIDGRRRALERPTETLAETREFSKVCRRRRIREKPKGISRLQKPFLPLAWQKKILAFREGLALNPMTTTRFFPHNFQHFLLKDDNWGGGHHHFGHHHHSYNDTSDFDGGAAGGGGGGDPGGGGGGHNGNTTGLLIDPSSKSKHRHLKQARVQVRTAFPRTNN